MLHAILPDAEGTPTLWRYADPTDQLPQPVTTEAQLGDPHVWAALVTLYARPRDTGEPVHLLVGDAPLRPEGTDARGRLLVTVWPDGSGTAAWRATPEGADRWGPPSVLEPAP